MVSIQALAAHEQQVDVAVEREAQASWAALPIAARLRLLKRARHAMADATAEFADCLAANPARTRADSIGAEVIPLLEACRFLEREAASILKPRKLGRRGLPLLLTGIDSVVERVPLGRVLVIAPSNYPLMLAGIQVLQALAAGNTVVWKPGRGGLRVAQVFARVMHVAGLPAGVLRVTDESIEAATLELERKPDKVIFTGSSEAGKKVAELAAANATPMIAELSGCDAVVVLPSANFARVAAALTFGMRLNGSATCMAPRRLFLVGDGFGELLAKVQEQFRAVPMRELGDATRQQLGIDLEQARALGATVVGEAGEAILVLDGRPEMHIAQADIFAPVLTVLTVRDANYLKEAYRQNPYGLTVAVFGEETEARHLGETLCAGTLLVNDLIVPTVDPRVPFGGRMASGYGVTRGAEGLLELTAVRTVLTRRFMSLRQYEATGDAHEKLFGGAVAMSHGAGWRRRLKGLRMMFDAAREMR